MLYVIITTINARQDIQSAIDWENKRMQGLSTRLLKEINDKFLLLTHNPFLYQVRYEDIRCTMTNTFSYLIHYKINENLNQVIVLRILHTSKRPVW